jgi:parvulin-like peptidyl-prolyl isomerase
LTKWQRSSLRTRPEQVRGPQTLILLANIPTPGGALGWKTRGDLDPTFEEAAFNLEASTTANPKYVEVKTGFGYHIIMVEGRK